MSGDVLAQTCTCYDGNPENYEGPQADCAVYGAIRAFAEALRELAAAVRDGEKAKAALTRIADMIPELDGLPTGRVLKGLEHIHQIAAAALAISSAEATDQTEAAPTCGAGCSEQHTYGPGCQLATTEPAAPAAAEPAWDHQITLYADFNWALRHSDACDGNLVGCPISWFARKVDSFPGYAPGLYAIRINGTGGLELKAAAEPVS